MSEGVNKFNLITMCNIIEYLIPTNKLEFIVLFQFGLTVTT